MSAWANNDIGFGSNTSITLNRPKFSFLETRHFRIFTVANSQFTSGGNTKNVIVKDFLSLAAPQLSLNANVTGNNIIFGTTIQAYDTANNTLVLSANTTANVQVGDIMYVGNNTIFHANTFWKSYNRDTVLVTPGRRNNAFFANAGAFSVAVANVAAAAHTGWVHVTTGTGGRAGRVQTEVLVALSNTFATLTDSGNTSNSLTRYAGL
jgi:hypothetical protein